MTSAPNRRLEAQADKLFEVCEIIGWTRELHAAGIATDQLKGVREMAKVTERQGSRRGKRECRCVREAIGLASSSLLGRSCAQDVRRGAPAGHAGLPRRAGRH
jgi:hypothetical protein